MTTSDLKLAGPAAKVEISGDADLAKETQRLTVRVQPALSSSVSAGAALLFLANPLVGAAVGAGSLLAQKDAEGSDRADVQLRIHGDRQLVRSGRHARPAAANASAAPGAPGAPPTPRGNAMTASARAPARGRRADGVRRRRRRQSRAGRAAGRRGGGARRAARRAARVLRHPRRAGDRQAGRARDRGRRARSRRSWPGSREPTRIWLVGGTVPLACARPGARAQRLPRLRTRRATRRPLRQDPPVRVRARRRALRRRPDHRAGHRRGDLRRCRAAASGCRSATTCAFPSSIAAGRRSR